MVIDGTREFQDGRGRLSAKASLRAFMTTKTHATYIDLRERILFGDLKAGDPYSSSDMMRDYGIVVGMARRILVSMKVGGYLTRSGPSYVVSSFSHEQVEEWRIGLGSLVEIGALRMTLSGGQWLEDFTRYVEKNIRHVSIDDEDFFQAAIGLTNMVLGGPNSTLAAIVDQFIPQVFFRLLWMADFYSERRGYLVEASDRFLVAAHARDLVGVRAASRLFFDGNAPGLHVLIDNMGKGIYPTNDRKNGFQVIETLASGSTTDIGDLRTFTPILTPLSETSLKASPVF